MSVQEMSIQEMSVQEKTNKRKKTMIEVSISTGKKQRMVHVRTGSIACFENIGISLQDVVTFTEHVNSARYLFIAENGNLRPLLPLNLPSSPFQVPYIALSTRLSEHWMLTS